MENKLKQIFMITIALAVSFLITKLAGDVFFIGDTPMLRSNPAMYLSKKVGLSVGSMIASLKMDKTQDSQASSDRFASAADLNKALNEAIDAPLRQVATGTYASTVQGKEVQIIKLNEIPYKEYTYTIDGEKIVIRVPETMSPPSEKDVKAVKALK